MDVEDVFSSRVRMRIILIIRKLGQLNVSEIAHKLRVNYLTVREHLKVLEDEDLLEHSRYGRIRLYRLNQASAKTAAVQNLIEAWNLEQ